MGSDLVAGHSSSQARDTLSAVGRPPFAFAGSFVRISVVALGKSACPLLEQTRLDHGCRNVNHDGPGDLVARTASGSMLPYPGNGRAIFSRLARWSGWNVFDLVR